MNATHIITRAPQAAPGQISTGVDSRHGRGSHPIYDHPELAPQGYKERGDKVDPSVDKVPDFSESPHDAYLFESKNLIAEGVAVTLQHLDESLEKRRQALDSVFKSVNKCGSNALAAICEDGHIHAKIIRCGVEWCSTCGKDGSEVHLQRISRIAPKMRKLNKVGYFVIEPMDKDRDRFHDPDELRKVRLATHIVLKRHGIDRGFDRYHFFGDKTQTDETGAEYMKYNPHLNVLTDSGFIRPVELAEIKREMAKAWGVDQIILNYQYSKKPGMKIHWIKYVSRATFKDAYWDLDLARDLHNFRNCVWWGDWKSLADAPDAWEYKRTEHEHHLEKLENGICPVCDKPIKWVKDFVYKRFEDMTRREHEQRAARMAARGDPDYMTRIEPFLALQDAKFAGNKVDVDIFMWKSHQRAEFPSDVDDYAVQQLVMVPVKLLENMGAETIAPGWYRITDQQIPMDGSKDRIAVCTDYLKQAIERHHQDIERSLILNESKYLQDIDDYCHQLRFNNEWQLN